MSKFAELPDGTKLEFPDDTTDDVIDSTVKKHLGVSATPKSLADQIPGLLPEGTPEPAKPMSWKHLVAPLETGLSVGSGLIGGAIGTAVGSAQDAIDGTFNSKGPGPKAQQYAEALTYEPKLKESQTLTQKANKLLLESAGPLASIMPQLEAGTVFRGMKKDFNKGKAKVAEEAQLLEAIKKQQERKAATAPIEPSGELIGAQFGGRQAMPWDTPAETMPKSPLEPELVPMGERGLFGDNPRATPQEALKTTHDYPTIDFPLRQEVLEQPEIKTAIDNFRQQAAELEQVANNAISEKVRENARTQLTALQEEFGRHREQFGIKQPSDAYGRGLYESRGEDTTGSVIYPEKSTKGEPLTLDKDSYWENLKPTSPKPVGTTEPLGNTGKKQGGAIDPAVFEEGIKKLTNFVGPDVIKALRSGISDGDKSRTRTILMPIREYLKLAFDDPPDPVKTAGVLDKFKSGSKLDLSTIPELGISDFSNTPYVRGHEGRHRARYLQSQGLEYMPVRITSDRIRWGNVQDKNAFDFIRDDEYPKSLTNQDNNSTVPYPIPKAEARLPNAGVYKKQEGAFKFFVKEEKFDDFAKRVRELSPDISSADIDALWQERGNKAKQEITNVKLAKGLTSTETLGGIKLESITPEQVIESLKSSEDSPNNFGLYRKTLMPGGYMPAEFSNNPGLKVAYRYLKNTIDENARKAEMALFEAKTGLINAMTHLETLFGPGGGAELVKQWFKAKDNPDFQFNLTPAQQKVHVLKEKLFSSMLEDINSFLPEGKQVAELPNYIPSIHDGKWYIEVKTGDGRPVLYGAHNKFQLKAMQQYLNLKGYETSPIKVRGRYQDSRWGSNQFGDVNEVKAANYQYMLDLLTDADPQVQALGRELTKQIDSQAYTASGVHNRFKEYTGYEGNLGNNPLKSERTNYFDAKKALIQTVESHYSWVAAQKANQLNKTIMESGIPPNNAALVSEYINSNVIGKSSKTFVDTIAHGIGENVLGMSPQQVNQITNRSGNIVTAMLTSMGSPVHALQNVVQPLTVIFPHLFKERGNYMDLASALTKIPAEYAYVFLGKQLSEVAKLFGVEQGKYFGSEAFKTKMEFAQRTGIIDPTIVESTPMFQSKAANRVTDFAVQGVLSRPTEQAARWAVFSSMYDLGVRKGLSVEKAASRAKEITETYMVDYGPDAKARMFTENGIVGNTMGRLQSFAANQLAQTFLYIKNSKKSPSDAMAAMTYFTTLAALGGIVGLPFFDLVEKLVNAAKSKDGKTFSLRNEIRQTVGDGAIEGLWGKVGLGVAPSFGARTVGDNNLPSVLGFPTAGKIGQIAEAGARRLNPDHSWATEPDSEKGKELLAVSPIVARGVVEDKYLKPSFGGKTVNISAETGRVLHEQQPGEKSFGNIRSAERAKDADLNNQKFLEQQKQKEQSKKLEREIERRVLDTSLYGNRTQEKLERLNQDIKAYVQQGNNEADVEKLLNNSLAFAAISDAELAKMEKLAQANGDWKILNKVLMEKKYLDLRKEHRGIFNFGVGKKG